MPRKALLIAWVLFLFLLCLGLSSCGRSAGADGWRKVQALELAGRHDDALKLGTKLVAIRVDAMEPAEASNLLTDRYGYAPDRFAEDILALTIAIRDSAEATDFQAARGFIYAVIREYELAIADFDRVAASSREPNLMALESPTVGLAHYCKGLALWQKGDFEPALAQLDRVVADNPTCSRAWFYRGIVKEELGRRPEALADLTQACSFGRNQAYEGTLEELQGTNTSGELPYSTFMIAFFSNRAPLLRPYGYIWPLIQDTKH